MHNVVQKAKQNIVQQSKEEEKNIKAASKDLARIEKAERKAYKDIVKVEAKLEKAESLPEDSYADGGNALRQVQQAQIDFEIANQKYAQLHYARQELLYNVEAAMEVNDERTKERNVMLNALSGPAAPTEASRFVPVTEYQATRPSAAARAGKRH